MLYHVVLVAEDVFALHKIKPLSGYQLKQSKKYEKTGLPCCVTWYTARQCSENAVEIMSVFRILRKLMILGSLPMSTSTYTMFHAQTNLITSKVIRLFVA